MEISLARDATWTPDPTKPLTWAQAKCEHANAQGLRLQDRMHGWSNFPESTYTTEFSEDHLRFEIRLSDDFAPAPVQEWSLILGDVIHNLRAALDALVWAHADTAALNAKQRRDLHFPLCLTEAAWESARQKALLSVPDYVADRIRDHQPFLMPEPKRCVLLLLHRLDIRDKHKEMIGTRAVMTRFEHDLEWESLDDWPPDDDGDTEILPFELVPGAVAVRGWSAVPMDRLTGRLRLELDFMFAPDLAIGESVIELLAGLTSNIRAIVHHVEGTLAAFRAEMDRIRAEVATRTDR